METKLMKFIAFLLLLSPLCNCIPGNADYDCRLSDLAVTQSATPSKVVNGYRVSVYTVTVVNRCFCVQANVKLSCDGFNSHVAVVPDVLSLDSDGKLCTLNGGRPIGPGPDHAVRFSYARRSQFSFRPVSSTIACS